MTGFGSGKKSAGYSPVTKTRTLLARMTAARKKRRRSKVPGPKALETFKVSDQIGLFFG